MTWVVLCLAGGLEVMFALSMKSSQGFSRLLPSIVAVLTGLSSIGLLSYVLRSLPVGTAYAVWTGIGAAGTAIFGMLLLGDPAHPNRLACIGLIMLGVIGLRLFSPEAL